MSRACAVARVIALIAFVAPMAASAQASTNPDHLAGTTWRLVEIQSMDDAMGTVRPRDSSRFTMRLDTDGAVSFRLDCNRATGTWSAEPAGTGASGRFTFGPLAATRAMCAPPHLDERVTRDAPHVRSYLLRDGRLYLSLMADGGIFAWEPLPADSGAAVVPATPDEGGPRDWQVTGVSTSLNLRARPSTAAAVTASLAPGTVLDNLGCQHGQERIWCDVQPLGGGPRGYVAHDYLTPAVSPDGSAAMGPDNSALRAGQNDFDASGRIPCAQHAGQPMTTCAFSVARAGGGYATVVVTRPDGRTRILYFRMGRAIGVDTSEADPHGPFSATKEADLNLIRVGEERYEIPDAVPLGG